MHNFGKKKQACPRARFLDPPPPPFDLKMTTCLWAKLLVVIFIILGLG